MYTQTQGAVLSLCLLSSHMIHVPNDARDSRSRKYSIHSDDDFLDSVGGAHFDDDFGALSAEKPAIAAQRQGGAIQLFRFQGIQRRLDKVLRVVFLLKSGHAFT